MTTEQTPRERALALAQRALNGETAWSARMIAEEVGVSPRTVARWRREAGLTGEKGPPAMPQHEVERLRRQYVEEGRSVPEIARESGWSFRVVKRHLRDVLDPSRRRNKRRIATSASDIDRYVQYALQGDSAETIAEREGNVSAKTVRRRLAERREQEQGE